MSRITQRKETCSLSPETIDQMSDICVAALTEAEANKKDILRLRLSLEEILGEWYALLGDGVRCSCRTGSRFGRQYIEFSVAGERLDLQEMKEKAADKLLHAEPLYAELLRQAEIALTYSYKNGENRLSIFPRKKARLGMITQLGIAIAAAFLLNLLTVLLPQSVQSGITGITQPLLDALLGVIRAISSPLIFLSICCGILGIGDLSSMETIGKNLISRWCLRSLLLCALIVLGLLCFFPLSSGAESVGTGNFADIYQMLLDILPEDLISPFLTGNSLQIIFMGICLGVALLALGDRVSGVRSFIWQVNDTIDYLMNIISYCIPLIVFLSMYAIFSGGALFGLGNIFKLTALMLGAIILILAIYLVAISLRYKVRLTLLIKKMLPVFLIGLTTASSTAALSTNLEICKNKLGIPAGLTGFGVPLAHVLMDAGSLLEFAVLVFGMAEIYQVAITPQWLLVVVITVWVISMSRPPVLGSGLSCMTILFLQLGIPVEALAVATALDSVLDFPITAMTIVTEECELLLAADKMGVLDQEVLRSES